MSTHKKSHKVAAKRKTRVVASRHATRATRAVHKAPVKAKVKTVKHLVRVAAVPARVPAWQTDFPYPERLRHFWYGFNVNVSQTDYLHAQEEYTPREMADIKASGIDHVRYMFYMEHVARSPEDPRLRPEAVSCIRYVLAQFLANGINVILQVGSDGAARKDLGEHGRGWNQRAYNEFLVNLFNETKSVPGFSPDTVWLGVGNEMGLDVDDRHRSLPDYEQFLSSAISAWRAVAPTYTILYDLYPTGAADQWNYKGHVFQRPSDRNTVCSVHYYEPMAFAMSQGSDESAPWGQKYIYGFSWPMTNQQAIDYLNSFTAGGLYGTSSREGREATAQIDYWRHNFASIVGSRNFTEAAQDQYMAPLIQWARENQVALHCSEFGVSSEISHKFRLSSGSAAAWTSKVTSMLHDLGIGNCYWQYQDLTTGPPGARVLIKSKLERNRSRART